MAVHRRLAPLLAQFDFGVESLLGRIAGLTDDEYFWEPVENCWSVRKAGDDRGVTMYGKGDWKLEFDAPPIASADPPPVTTIAWRVAHLATGMTLRADWTVGSRALSFETVEMPGSAAEGIAALEGSAAFWREAVTTAAADDDLDRVGRSAFPWGLDPDLPFIDIVWWVNKEVIHHGAEIALLRDLWQWQPRDA